MPKTEIGIGAMDAVDQVVLLVEDNASNMRMFCDILQSRGYTTAQATNGEHGWDMALALHPNLILLDIQLPDISGYDVVSRLKAHKDLRSIPVIALTAFAMVGDQEKCLASGFDAYISKPVKVLDFLQTVEGYLNLPPTALTTVG